MMTIKIFLYEASLVNNLWYSYLSTAHTTHNIRILKIFLYEASLVNNLWYKYISTTCTTQNIQNTDYKVQNTGGQIHFEGHLKGLVTFLGP